jgi:ubiquinone/menaquinone biosynthesis C-methylase UbiE
MARERRDVGHALSQSIASQFGRHAEAYLTSPSHARGHSLQRLLELCPPQPDWRVLDVATGAGHTALAFAPPVRQVVAADLTPEMLGVTRRQAESYGITNLDVTRAEATTLPFASATFDLITCRIAAHPFPAIAAAVRDMARACKPGGVVAIADNVVPLHSAAARYVNAFEKLRDPSHVRCYPLADWKGFFVAAGLEVVHTEEFRKPLDFDDWVSRANVVPADRIRLEVLLKQAPAYGREALTPGVEGGRITFYLSEALIIGRR